MIFKLEIVDYQRTLIQSVVEVFLYPSFRAPLELLWSLYGDSELTRSCDGDLREMSRISHGDLTEVCASGNVCSSAHEAGFVGSRIYVHKTKNPCSFIRVSYRLTWYPKPMFNHISRRSNRVNSRLNNNHFNTRNIQSGIFCQDNSLYHMSPKFVKMDFAKEGGSILIINRSPETIKTQTYVQP